MCDVCEMRVTKKAGYHARIECLRPVPHSTVLPHKLPLKLSERDSVIVMAKKLLLRL